MGPGAAGAAYAARAAELEEADERLARASAAGEEEAFTTLYERCAPRLHACCWTILRDETAAQDVLQSTWLNAARRVTARTAPPGQARRSAAKTVPPGQASGQRRDLSRPRCFDTLKSRDCPSPPMRVSSMPM